MEQFLAFNLQLLLGDRQIEAEGFEGVQDRLSDIHTRKSDKRFLILSI
jgi:hypothetical protein